MRCFQNFSGFYFNLTCFLFHITMFPKDAMVSRQICHVFSSNLLRFQGHENFCWPLSLLYDAMFSKSCDAKWFISCDQELFYITIISISTFLHDQRFLMITVFSWWTFSHDKRFLMISVFSWPTFPHDQRFLMINVSSWSAFSVTFL